MTPNIGEDNGRAVLRLDPQDVFPGPGETAESYFARMSKLSNALLDAVGGAIQAEGGFPKTPVTGDVAETKMKAVSKKIAENVLKSEDVKQALDRNAGILGDIASGQADMFPHLLGDKKEPVQIGKPKAFVLDGAKDIVYGARQHMYGHASTNFARTAQMWEPIFGAPVNNLQVGLAMILLKVARGGNLVQREATGGPRATFDEIEDTMKDIAGYAEATMRSLFENPDGSRLHQPK